MSGYLIRFKGKDSDQGFSAGRALIDRLGSYADFLDRIAAELHDAYIGNRGKVASERVDGFAFDMFTGLITATSIGGVVFHKGEPVDRPPGRYIAAQKDAVAHMQRCARWARHHLELKLFQMRYVEKAPIEPDEKGCPESVYKEIERCKRAAEEELKAAGIV